MDDLETKLASILQNPEMMGKIMNLAQTMGANQPPQDPAPKAAEGPALPNVDLSMVQKLAGLAGQSSIDADQRNLLGALRPYLSPSRIGKLERAMRAAKIASMSGILTGKHPSGR